MFENSLVKHVIMVQKRVRSFLARQKVNNHRKISSIKIFEQDFSQEGENFYTLMFKKLSTGIVTLYCWNLSTMERYPPLTLGADQKRASNYEFLWRKVYLCIEANTLYNKDFWGNPNDPISQLNIKESEKASKFMLSFVKNKKFFRRFKAKTDFKLIGKKSYIYKNESFILLGLLKESTSCFKISLFSKRANDVVQTNYFYNYQMIKSNYEFAQERFDSVVVQPLRVGNILRMTFDTKMIDDSLLNGVKLDTKVLLLKLYEIYRERKLVSTFKYYVDISTVFIFEVFWLFHLGTLMFKISISGEEGMVCPKQLEIPLHVTQSNTLSVELSDNNNTVDRTVLGESNEAKIIFQIIKLNFDDLCIDQESLTNDAIQRLCEFIIMEKLKYKECFYLQYFEPEESANAMFPKKILKKTIFMDTEVSKISTDEMSTSRLLVAPIKFPPPYKPSTRSRIMDVNEFNNGDDFVFEFNEDFPVEIHSDKRSILKYFNIKKSIHSPRLEMIPSTGSGYDEKGLIKVTYQKEPSIIVENIDAIEIHKSSISSEQGIINKLDTSLSENVGRLSARRQISKKKLGSISVSKPSIERNNSHSKSFNSSKGRKLTVTLPLPDDGGEEFQEDDPILSELENSDIQLQGFHDNFVFQDKRISEDEDELNLSNDNYEGQDLQIQSGSKENENISGVIGALERTVATNSRLNKTLGVRNEDENAKPSQKRSRSFIVRHKPNPHNISLAVEESRGQVSRPKVFRGSLARLNTKLKNVSISNSFMKNLPSKRSIKNNVSFVDNSSNKMIKILRKPDSLKRSISSKNNSVNSKKSKTNNFVFGAQLNSNMDSKGNIFPQGRHLKKRNSNRKSILSIFSRNAL